ncbi:hypothetical protein BY996DRAFT_7770281 [Phakopsora pachyrhizi]|nr:hypothetical protein BY996DRAFT_7770281 [Phakopsora pachyrhizi]
MFILVLLFFSPSQLNDTSSFISVPSVTGLVIVFYSILSFMAVLRVTLLSIKGFEPNVENEQSFYKSNTVQRRVFSSEFIFPSTDYHEMNPTQGSTT